MKKKLMRVVAVVAVFGICTSFVSNDTGAGHGMKANKVDSYAVAATL